MKPSPSPQPAIPSTALLQITYFMSDNDFYNKSVLFSQLLAL